MPQIRYPLRAPFFFCLAHSDDEPLRSPRGDAISTRAQAAGKFTADEVHKLERGETLCARCNQRFGVFRSPDRCGECNLGEPVGRYDVCECADARDQWCAPSAASRCRICTSCWAATRARARSAGRTFASACSTRARKTRTAPPALTPKWHWVCCGARVRCVDARTDSAQVIASCTTRIARRRWSACWPFAPTRRTNPANTCCATLVSR